MKNEKGFTLIEMLIVLMIISVLVLITIPNVMKHFKTVDEKGCSAYLQMVQSQVQAYKIDHNEYPTIDKLLTEDYLASEEAKCPDGRAITVDNGKAKISEASASTSTGTSGAGGS